jgi:uncharacterized membrane protein YbhN (UPF0104 family)
LKKKMTLILTAVFFLLVAWMLFQRIDSINPDDIVEGFRRIEMPVLITAVCLVVFDYLILATFDYLGFRTSGQHFMNYPRVLFCGTICYAFTLNVGALVGGVGFRYRVYSQWKVDKDRIPYIILLSTASNWSGFILLFSLTLLQQPQILIEKLNLAPMTMTLIGVACVALLIFYFILCFRGHSGKWNNKVFFFPKISLAILQLFLSVLQWMIVGLILYLFMDELEVTMSYLEVMLILLITGMAGIITHIPGSLGVLEAIFLKMGPSDQAPSILVALICYRAVYYLLPLAVAVPHYIGMEIYLKRKSIKSIPE